VTIDRKDSRILLVDDDRELADALVESLSNLGYSAKAAYSGREGLNTFEKWAFQLVITDLKMPDMDGIELLRAVKTLDKEAVVIIITGYGTIESAVKAIRQGAYDYITKPVKMNELELVIDRALERRTLSKRLGIFRGLTLALIISVPMWLVLGIVLALLWK
jgi:DNA-binding NtrC family response regulator